MQHPGQQQRRIHGRKLNGIGHNAIVRVKKVREKTLLVRRGICKEIQDAPHALLTQFRRQIPVLRGHAERAEPETVRGCRRNVDTALLRRSVCVRTIVNQPVYWIGLLDEIVCSARA